MASKAIGTVLIELSATTANLQKSLTEGKNSLQKFEKDVKSIATNLKTALGVGIAVGAIKSLGELTSSIGELAERGEKVSDLRETFNALGGSAAGLDAAKEALLGTVSSVDLMQIATKGLAARIPNFNKNFAEISVLGAKAAKVLGVDTKQAIDDLVSSMAREKGIGIVKQMGIAIPTIENFRKVFGGVPTETDSASKAIASFKITLGEIGDTFGMAINENEDLRQAFRDLDIAVKSVDWSSFATALAEIIALGAEAVGGIVYLGNAIGDLISEAMEPGSVAVRNFQTEYVNLGKQLLAARTKDQLDGVSQGIQGLVEQMRANPKLATEMGGQVIDLYNKMVSLKGVLPTTALGVKDWGKAVDEAAKQAAQAEKEIAKLQDAFNKQLGGLEKDVLGDSIKNSIDRLDEGTFSNLAEQMHQAVYQSSYDGLRQTLDAGIITEADADRMATLMADRATNPYKADFEAKMSEANFKVAEDLARKQQEQFQTALSFFSGIFSEFASTGTVNWGNLLKGMAVDFVSGMAAEMATKLGGGFLAGLLDPSGVGKSIGDAIIGAVTGGGGGGLGGAIDSVIGALGFAKGGVFDGGQLLRAANGMTVDRPTPFIHSGGLGVMGEAGPEAIMPLTRVGGSLGVRVSGGAGGRQIIIDARGAAPGVEHIIRGIVDDMSDAIVDRAVQMSERRAFLGSSHNG